VEGFEAYLAAYLLEKSLSLDNVFVFSVIFTSFAVPERDRYHVLFYGVIGAMVFRAIFVLAGTALLSAFSWLVFVFGAFLIFTGLRMIRRDDEQTDYRNNRVLKLFRRFMRFSFRWSSPYVTPSLQSEKSLRGSCRLRALPEADLQWSPPMVDGEVGEVLRGAHGRASSALGYEHQYPGR
jgi:predicted tellurium resistance membrane protein TerC